MIDPVSTPLPQLWSTADLRSRMTKRQIAAEVASGRLVRVRRGFFVTADCHPEILRAARLHGRLDCVSLLVTLGVFVLECRGLHLQVEPGTTDLPPAAADVVRHWRCVDIPRTAMIADIVGAVAQACRCQGEVASIATLDSAWHRGLLHRESLAEVFAALPRKLRRLRLHLDRRSESGPESILRFILRQRGYRVEVQVEIAEVGRVDLLIDGWLIVECDSAAHHSSWEAQRRDRRRDQAAARLGYSTLRPIAEDIMWHTDDVVAAIVGLIVARVQAAVLNLADPLRTVRL